MTVAELIKRLGAFPPNTLVVADDRDSPTDITEVELCMAKPITNTYEGVTYVTYGTADFETEGYNLPVVLL